LKDLTQNCEVVIAPTFGNKYIHFHYFIFVNGECLDRQESTSGPYGNFNYLSFRYEDISKYILCEDKKSYRAQQRSSFKLFDGKVSADDIAVEGYPGHLIPRGHFSNGRGRYRVKSIKCIPVKICPRCARGVDYQSYIWNPSEISDFNKCTFSETIFKFRLCDNDACRSKKGTVFWSRARYRGYDFESDREVTKDPRAFLYESKVKPKKSFFKKYISRHLNRVRKLRPISQQEVSFFRSWLGAKDIAALAN
jgi:hypothetical protein